MVLIYTLRKTIALLTTVLLIGISFAPLVTNIAYAENPPIEIDSGETDNLDIGKTIYLRVNWDEFDTNSLVISPSNHVELNENELTNQESEQIKYDQEKNIIGLNWEDNEEISEIEIPLVITDSGEAELEIKEEAENETIKTDTIEFTIPEPENKENDKQHEENSQSDKEENNSSISEELPAFSEETNDPENDSEQSAEPKDDGAEEKTQNEEAHKEKNDDSVEKEFSTSSEETDNTEEKSEQDSNPKNDESEEETQNEETQKENSGDSTEEVPSTSSEKTDETEKESEQDPKSKVETQNEEAQKENSDGAIEEPSVSSEETDEETDEAEEESRQKESNAEKEESNEEEQTHEENPAEEESSENTQEVETNQITLASTTNTVVEVRDWDSFLDALENPEIQEIQVMENFSAGGGIITHEYDVNGNKIISGNGFSIDFGRYRINIHNNNVMIEDLNIRADQNRTLIDATIFYSEDPGAVIHFNDTSFDGVQEAQVTLLPQGHVKISGDVTFQTERAFEVFETQKITFMENSTFLGETTDVGLGNRKPTLNLQNNPTVVLEPNASVTLSTQTRKSILNADDGSANSILEIGDNASLHLYAGNVDTNNGESLINFTSENSSITMGENSTLDMENHREDDVGSLITMNGTLSLPEEGSKVSYWDAGAHSDTDSGAGYTSFPRILNGELAFNNEVVRRANAETTSTLAHSDNPEKDGKTFEETFLDKNFEDVKRLTVAEAENPLSPSIDEVTDKDTTLTGTATPGVTIQIQDPYGQTWETQTDPETGYFSVELGDYAPYDVNDQLIVKAIDSSGAESDETTTSITGSILSFRVPETLNFQQVIKQDENMIVPRQDKEWAIQVVDTREDNSGWNLSAKTAGPLTAASGHQLNPDALVFMRNGNTQSLAESVNIHTEEASNDYETTIDWNENEGVLLQLNPVTSDVQTNTEYTTTIDWTLADAP